MLCKVCSVQCAVCCVLCAGCSVQYAVCCSRCAVCSVQYVVYYVQVAVCSMQYVVYGVQCAVCSMLCTVCRLQCAVCSMLCTVCRSIGSVIGRISPTLISCLRSAVGRNKQTNGSSGKLDIHRGLTSHPDKLFQLSETKFCVTWGQGQRNSVRML